MGLVKSGIEVLGGSCFCRPKEPSYYLRNKKDKDKWNWYLERTNEFLVKSLYTTLSDKFFLPRNGVIISSKNAGDNEIVEHIKVIS